MSALAAREPAAVAPPPQRSARVTLAAPESFSFRRTVLSHGWCLLPPFAFDRSRWRLHRVVDLPARALSVEIRSGGRRRVRIDVAGPLAAEERKALHGQVRTMLGLDEDLSSFYERTSRVAAFAWIARSGAGRLLRAPTVWEDLVKLLCTTNCSWSFTETMLSRIVGALGRRVEASVSGRSARGFTRRGSKGSATGRSEAEKGFMKAASDGGAVPDRAFPTPGAMARAGERFFRRDVRAGYRSGALAELADSVASGAVDVESWRTSPLPTAELKKRILRLRGVGPYAAENLLRLVGRHEGLALDSWCRATFSRLHARGRPVADGRIERTYARFGSHRGLALWCDLTRDWLDTAEGDRR